MIKKQRERLLFAGLLVPALVAALLGSPASAQSFESFRQYEPVVIEGGRFADWVGSVDATRITFHVFRNNVLVPIPFQYDKRRKIHVNFNVGPGEAGYPFENCEYGYYTELFDGPSGQGPRADFASNTLQATDEFVFLLKDVLVDTGLAGTSNWIVDTAVANDRYEIILFDPSTNAYRYVYAFRWSDTPPSGQIDSTDYIRWVSDTTTIPPCPLVPTACSTVETIPAAALADVATVDVHFRGNWITDALTIRDHGSDATARPDLFDRMRYEAPQGETEDGWSNALAAQFLGYTDGKIRVVRAIQGALSGQRTTKYEFIYPTMFVTRRNLRVHDLAFLNILVDHDDNFGFEGGNSETKGFVWSASSYAATPKVPFDGVDGACVPPPGECRLSLYGFGDWVQTNSPQRAAYVHLNHESRLIPIESAGSREPRYTDYQAGASPAVAKFGNGWNKLACTEDGLDGRPTGCLDPEAGSLWFARLDSIIVPVRTPLFPASDSSIIAQVIAGNLLQLPVQSTSRKQNKDVPLPPPELPCAPTISASDPHTGAAKLDFGPPLPCGGTTGRRVFRAEGSGAFVFVKDVGTASTWTDHMTIAGQSYSYKVVSYNQGNVASSASSVATITPIDTTPPPTPGTPTGTVTGTTVTLAPPLPCTHDLDGLNVYFSQISGGPYTKLNNSPISVGVRPVSWTQAGFQPNHVYYFVLTSVDFSGNESGFSGEFVIQTGS